MMFNPSLKFRRQAKGKIQKKWQLFNATDFQSLMYPCFTFCRILGMFPYKINTSTLEIYKPLFIVWSVIVCVCCIGELVILYQINISGTINMRSVPRTLERSSYYSLSNLVVVVTYILSGPRMRLLQTILDISSTLPLESYRKLSWLIHTKDIIGTSYVIGIVLIYHSRMRVDVMMKFFVIYVNMLVFEMDMMYMNCVCVLKACFKGINDNLINLQKLIVNSETHLFQPIYYVQRNSFLLIKLKALKKQHLRVSDTVQMLNIIFSLQIIATIILTFIEMTFNIYYYILQWREDVLILIMEKQLYHAYFFICIAYFFTKITLIIWACETGKNQASEIGTTVHDVLNCTNNEQIKYELQLFSLQILHHKNKFSAKGFTVDATLLAAIIGNVTTYILILMQFLSASYSCDGKTIVNVTLIKNDK
ncbi:PREDICTED: putative gustatory receptor 28b [Vollenhovia emeryi]|uniref:putative gustatory receptor 28b n=1 Tax=Vollenhovia emeryi TaxID=411798 RepID=UPI0005F47C6B|nr:PREDICTED: putative gustatory receptor 28b [Vollenhovia emeryi]